MNLNLERETHKVHNKKIDEQIDSFVTWIKAVNGPDADTQEAIDFIYKYLFHLNLNTKKSFFEYLLDITNTRLIDVNKQNDLMLLIEGLYKLLQELKTL